MVLEDLQGAGGGLVDVDVAGREDAGHGGGGGGQFGVGG